MKKITLLLLLISSFGFSQQQQYNLGFEDATPSGILANWVTFEGPSPAAEIVVNPDADGVNTSTTTKVLKFNMVQAGACYSGAINTHGTLGTWQLDAAIPSNQTLTMKVNKSIVGKVGVKFVNATNGTVFEITNDQGLVSTVNEWVTLSWNISGFNVGDNVNIDQVVVFIDWRCTGEVARPSDVQLLVDDISWGANKLTDPVAAPTCTDGIQNGTETGIDCGGSCAACPGQEPLTAAPTPTRPAANVISMFSNAYTNVGVDTWRTGWSAATLADVDIVTNPTKKYTDLDFVGIETTGANFINASGMSYFHIDAWTPNMTEFRIKLVDFGANAAYAGGDDVESQLVFTPLQQGWNSYDINLNDFTGLTTKEHIAQLILSGNPAGSGILFVDNVYFSNVALSANSFEASKVKMYPNPANNIVTIDAIDNVESVSIVNLLGQTVMNKEINATSFTLDISNLNAGHYFINLISNNNKVVKKIIKN